MTRRYTRSSQINDLNETTGKIVSVVSTGRSFENFDSGQKYFKRNYIDALKKIIPQVYFNDEIELSGNHVNYVNQVINSHMIANNSIATILPVSAIAGDKNLSSIDTPSLK